MNLKKLAEARDFLRINLLVSFFLIISCATAQRQNDRFSEIIKCIQNDRFTTFFGICTEKTDSITIYDNTKTFLGCPDFELECDKKVNIIPSDFEIDYNGTNHLGKELEKKIVLLQYTKTTKGYEMVFLNIRNNATLLLEFNHKHTLVRSEGGVM